MENIVAAANQLPQGLVVLDSRLRPLAIFPLPGQPSAVYQVPRSQRFMVTLRDLPQLYFIRYPELKLQLVELSESFEDFIFVPGTTRLVASSRKGSRLILYDFERDEILATLDTESLPHLFSASFFRRNGVLHAAFNHMGVPRLSIIDMDEFKVVAQLPLVGSGYFTRTHPGTPYLWIDSNTESIQLVDKRTLELVDRTLIPGGGQEVDARRIYRRRRQGPREHLARGRSRRGVRFHDARGGPENSLRDARRKVQRRQQDPSALLSA